MAQNAPPPPWGGVSQVSFAGWAGGQFGLLSCVGTAYTWLGLCWAPLLAHALQDGVIRPPVLYPGVPSKGFETCLSPRSADIVSDFTCALGKMRLWGTRGGPSAGFNSGVNPSLSLAVPGQPWAGACTVPAKQPVHTCPQM